MLNEEIDTVVNSTHKSKVLFDVEAKESLLAGATLVAKAVGITLGPKGKTVLIQQQNKSPILTKDGVTVLKSINLSNPIMRMGADLLKDVAQRTNDLAGDGTTTSTVVAHAMMQEGYKLISSGYDVGNIIETLPKIKNIVLDYLKCESKDVSTEESINAIATISANNDNNIGELIAKAISTVGRDGIVTVEDAKGTNTTLDVVEGIRFDDRGYLSPYFVNNNDRMTCQYDDCAVLITDKKIGTMNEIVPILEYVLKIGKPLLIIADGIENEALQTLVLNRVKSNLRIVAINAPGHISVRNEILEDIAALTNAEVISSKKGTSFTDAVKCLGSIKRIIVSQRSTTFIGSGKELPRVQERLNSLKTFISDLGSEPNEISIAKMRLARLSGGVAIIRVGGLTETEVVEKRYRIEDALNATKAAIDEGYIPGGGLVLYKIAKKLINVKDDSGALKIFISGCLSPLKTICKNANVSYDVIDTKLENYINDDNNHDIGYNAKKNDIGHLVDEGIIDPVKVTRCAIEHATSITSAFLSLDAAIIEDVK